MPRVIFSSELQLLTGEVHYDAKALNYRDLVEALLLRYKSLDREALYKMAIVIDGVIIPDPLLETIPADSEVHFIHFVAGG